jgi:hypothetical protein
MVRQKVKDGNLEEAETAVRDLFATPDRVRPEGLRYASTRLVDSSTFVILTELAEGIEDPRSAMPEYPRFQQGRSSKSHAPGRLALFCGPGDSRPGGGGCSRRSRWGGRIRPDE